MLNQASKYSVLSNSKKNAELKKKEELKRKQTQSEDKGSEWLLPY